MRLAAALAHDASGLFILNAESGPGDAVVGNWLRASGDASRRSWEDLEAALSRTTTEFLTIIEPWVFAYCTMAIPRLPVRVALKLADDVTAMRVTTSLREIANQPGARGRAIVEALYAESSISILCWADLFNRIGDGTPHLENVRQWGVRHTLHGPSATYETPLGRVVEKNSFVTNLMRYANLPRQVARDAVADLQSDPTWESTRDACAHRGLAMGGRPSWATFDEQGRDPFYFASGKARRAQVLKGSLGLERSAQPARRYAPSLLLRYEADVDARIPTTADAAGSTPWNYYYAPSVADDRGLTKPWDDESLDLQPRPEIVHEPVSIAYLSQPVEEVR